MSGRQQKHCFEIPYAVVGSSAFVFARRVHQKTMSQSVIATMTEILYRTTPSNVDDVQEADISKASHAITSFRLKKKGQAAICVVKRTQSVLRIRSGR